MTLWTLKKTTEACVWTKAILKDSYSTGKIKVNMQSRYTASTNGFDLLCQINFKFVMCYALTL
jgi:hypothetical protein